MKKGQAQQFYNVFYNIVIYVSFMSPEQLIYWTFAHFDKRKENEGK